MKQLSHRNPFFIRKKGQTWLIIICGKNSQHSWSHWDVKNYQFDHILLVDLCPCEYPYNFPVHNTSCFILFGYPIYSHDLFRWSMSNTTQGQIQDGGLLYYPEWLGSTSRVIYFGYGCMAGCNLAMGEPLNYDNFKLSIRWQKLLRII